jgi:pilus assembly protein CpaF
MPMSHYLDPAGSSPLCSDELLRVAHARLAADHAWPLPPHREREALRVRVEALVKAMATDPEFRALAGFDADLARIRQRMEAFVALLMDDVMLLGPLAAPLKDPCVTEIMVNPGGSVFVERGPQRIPSRPFLDARQVRAVLARLVESGGHHLTDLGPMGEVCLPGGIQIDFALPPVSPEGPGFTVRRVPSRHADLDELVTGGVLSEKAALFLRACIRERLNIVISGGSRSGKTMLLDALSYTIPRTDRVVAIEDRRQLSLNMPNRIVLQTSPAAGIGMEPLLSHAMRLQPDRLIIGQCRGKETLDMLLAMTTGQEGCLATVHASSPRDLVNRLVVLSQMAATSVSDAVILRQVRLAVQVVVQMQRRPDGLQHVTHITALDAHREGTLGFTDIFVRQSDGGPEDPDGPAKLVATGLIPEFHARFQRSGIELPPGLYAA